MIDIKELRFGNYLKVISPFGTHKIGDFIGVSAISPCGLNNWRDYEGINTLDCVEPIRLTEETLKKLGFTRCFLDLYGLNAPHCQYEARPLIKDNYDHWYIENFYPIEFVHLFQNNYFFDYLEELEVTF